VEAPAASNLAKEVPRTTKTHFVAQNFLQRLILSIQNKAPLFHTAENKFVALSCYQISALSVHTLVFSNYKNRELSQGTFCGAAS